jgi:quercetin dioxygenase-like cupin family protein
MKITRWTAQIEPNKHIILQLIQSEGIDYSEVIVSPGVKLSNLRTNMRELIQIVAGELIFNLSGNQFVLRGGDRLELPSNTLYSYSNLKDINCLFMAAKLI